MSSGRGESGKHCVEFNSATHKALYWNTQKVIPWERGTFLKLHECRVLSLYILKSLLRAESLLRVGTRNRKVVFIHVR